MGHGIPNHGEYARQAANLGPLSRRAQTKRQEEFSNLFLKERANQKQEVEDAVFRTVGKIVDQKPKLGENPHVVDSFKYHRNGFQAREAISKKEEMKSKVDKAWQDQSSKAKQRKFTTLDNDPIAKTAKPVESLQEKISRLEERVSSLEEQVISDRFSSNPNVSFPENARGLKHADSHYQSHGKSYSSMLADLGKTTNRIGIG